MCHEAPGMSLIFGKKENDQLQELLDRHGYWEEYLKRWAEMIERWDLDGESETALGRDKESIRPR